MTYRSWLNPPSLMSSWGPRLGWVIRYAQPKYSIQSFGMMLYTETEKGMHMKEFSLQLKYISAWTTSFLTSKYSELISGSINIGPRKKLILSCLYRPPNRQDQQTTDKVIHDISDLRSRHNNYIFILGGDFNLQYTINGSQTTREVNNAFMQMTADLNLQQVVDILTRGNNILDLLLTSHHGQVSRCKTIPPLGNSDHDVVLQYFATHITRPSPQRRTIFLWKKANINGIREELLGKKDISCIPTRKTSIVCGVI